ncbi:GAF domain-containing protein [Streptomyces sp. gb14]|uniref:GAF domain-containing protein n=1 Tax=Streptomyces sp. gb14 TaxID=1827753 RepID=UPI000BF0D027
MTALVCETVVRTEADAVEVHLTDPAQDDALFLEKHHRLTPAYADSAALVFDGPDICARARHHAAPVTVPDVITDTELIGHRAGRLLTDAGTRSLHSTPLLTADGHCTGTLTLHWSKPGLGPSATQQKTSPPRQQHGARGTGAPSSSTHWNTSTRRPRARSGRQRKQRACNRHERGTHHPAVGKTAPPFPAARNAPAAGNDCVCDLIERTPPQPPPP